MILTLAVVVLPVRRRRGRSAVRGVRLTKRRHWFGDDLDLQ